MSLSVMSLSLTLDLKQARTSHFSLNFVTLPFLSGLNSRLDLFYTQFNTATVCMYLYTLLAELCNLILPEDGFEIKPKYYGYNHFLFLTRVSSLQDLFLSLGFCRRSSVVGNMSRVES